ncbi:MAG: hypothetical protein HOW73_08575 [Polyangiaceae bacterium]|nr:hypothetical protein [Polyangiaceae bacterium]
MSAAQSPARPDDRREGSGIRPSIGETLLAYSTTRLDHLCRAASFDDVDRAEAVRVFADLVGPWAEVRSRFERTDWVSEISDDNTPIEFSVAMAHDRADVRVLFEPQGRDPTVSSFREASLELHERIERDYGADLARFRVVEDLFAPEGMAGPFAIWSSVVFSPNKRPAFKTYFNPQASGRGRASALVEEALDRLGFPSAWAALCKTATRRGPRLDEIKYFALDLSADAQARIKVYVRHHEATPDDLEQACSGQRGHVPGDAVAFARAMRGGTDPMSARGPFTCSAFVEGDDERPSATTLYVPVCAYATDDGVVRDRVRGYLADQVAIADRYTTIVDGYANRPLSAGTGMQSWVALQRSKGVPRITVYLATEAAEVFEPGTVPAPTTPVVTFESVEEAIAAVREQPLDHHPFVERAQRGDDPSVPIWKLIASVGAGASDELPTWIAGIVSRVHEPKAKQIVGRRFGMSPAVEGEDGPCTAGQLTSDVVAAVRAIRTHDEAVDRLDGDVASIRERLAAVLATHYKSSDATEAATALVVGDDCMQQMLWVIAMLVPVEPPVTRSEPDEASAVVSVIVAAPPSTDSAARAALGIHRAFWQALDELYVSCFGRARDPASRDSIPPSLEDL